MTPEETHPLRWYKNAINNLIGGFLPVGFKVLMMGTFPPEIEYLIKRNGFFFFSSHRNHLWNRFDNIFNHLLGYRPLKKTFTCNSNETYEQNRKRKEEFLTVMKIGFIDIFSKVHRKASGSTKDSDLIPTENILQNGCFQAIIQSENIDRICCVYSLAFDVLKAEMIKRKEFTVKEFKNANTANGEKLQVEVFGKSFEVVLLYPATRSRHKWYLKDQQYKIFLHTYCC